ncbi:5-formyltetrahydrofolate cyclo-ligase [Leeuwenhoekiella sp. MAR_2009_132]|uniref:5-formyltetrahydrofolate cyclo-ligase n=1 Tax=Leeuwenhoekiella sp. MAR_2009_132 TaxID=1392489 RepID=UPI000490B0E2|nr:5-formyltetrahydrofolate cyclo-ligase [Leeuwenhoekiella sp. MAR_2009_132]
MTKAEYRKIYKEKRNNLSLSEIDELSLSIANQLLKLPIWDYEFYHIFLSIEHLKEVNTDYILNILNGKDKHIVISKSDFQDSTMRHYLLTDSTRLIINKWGIPEPQNGIEITPTQLDVIFIPLLAFDQIGSRIGYGKGFYDRFLNRCRPGALKIGLSLFEAEKNLPHNNKDITLTHCITPNKTYNF